MKKMKKVLAVILSLAMVLGMSLTSFAEDHKPVSTDEAVVTVNGVAAGATVKEEESPPPRGGGTKHPSTKKEEKSRAAPQGRRERGIYE